MRELQNVLERAVLLCKGDTVMIDALPFGQAAGEAMAAATQMSPRPATVIVDSPPARSDTVAPSEPEAFTFDDIGRLIVDRVPDPKTGALPVDVFGQIERAVVTAALSRTKGNKQAAASLLGLYRPRLYSLIKKHNVSTP